MAGGQKVKGEMLSANPSEVARRLMAHFEGAPEPAECYTEPHIVWHSYEGFDKIKKLAGTAPREARPPRYAESGYERIQVIDGEAAVTVLLTTRVKTFEGREFKLEAAMVHLLNAEGKIHRVEAYYDPRELERDAWIRVHLPLYDGVKS